MDVCYISYDSAFLHRGKGGPLGADHEIEIEFFGEINPEESKYEVKQRNIPMELMRKEEGEYWPRLLKTKSKVSNGCHIILSCMYSMHGESAVSCHFSVILIIDCFKQGISKCFLTMGP